MARHKDTNWNINPTVTTWVEVNAAILMDIRDELKRLNNLLHCPNFIDIPRKLERVARNTVKPKRRRKRAGEQPQR